jgi:hypothetical protein
MAWSKQKARKNREVLEEFEGKPSPTTPEEWETFSIAEEGVDFIRVSCADLALNGAKNSPTPGKHLVCLKVTTTHYEKFARKSNFQSHMRDYHHLNVPEFSRGRSLLPGNERKERSED